MNAEFVFDNIVTQVKLGNPCAEKFTSQDLQAVDIQKLYANGFRNWDGSMVLLPLWALAHMADGSQLRCIDGSYATVGADVIDDDVRGGCIAFGVERQDIPQKQ
jgi:hypothetical protein